MIDAERESKIASYGNAHAYLVSALERFPKEMWRYRPGPGQWSIHEIIIHIADSEVNSYIRCRRFLAEPGKELMAYDENQWARELDYHNQSPEDALELFRWLRRKSHELVSSAPDDAWARECFHPEDGTISLNDWLDTYDRHIPDHARQMQAVYAQWQKNSQRAS